SRSSPCSPNFQRPAVSSPMGPRWTLWNREPGSIAEKSCTAPIQATCRYSDRRSSIWSSTSRRPKPLTSTCPCSCSTSPTKSSNETEQHASEAIARTLKLGVWLRIARLQAFGQDLIRGESRSSIVMQFVQLFQVSHGRYLQSIEVIFTRLTQ